MLRKVFGAGIALLLVAGVALAEKKNSKEAGPHAYGKVISLQLKDDGTGTVSVLASKSQNEKPSEMTFKVTKDTQFQISAGPGKEGTPVEASKLSETFKKDQTVVVRFEGEANNLTAKRVSSVTHHKKPDNK